ncbi:VIT1/CCC1 transporter family protein [Garciella nitratireducens]|uniref:Predicted Fe2+/Mn2+ transporter, VIT1/CCC1 family n=1 Tax=Garciella nitratireducens DSM 15102 TaxID=1121911 RepID=A0A1T4PAJ5_9FIRM|nr:VIT1/CCC1 transporter family protein [Garciella nitratireducens]SJZ88522.1 Predicted Fe2+/Mn2+ transporter, VIT1/CCC1 family [Garciella nitratireducens DSM 15102]
MDQKFLKKVKLFQQKEITENEIYLNIAKKIKDEKNRTTLEKIAEEEMKHYEIWEKYTNEEMQPVKREVLYYTFLAKLFGYTFAIKKMENQENQEELEYIFDQELLKEIPEAEKIYQDELVHEKKLIDLLDEERLRYIGSMVLGLNDALVEFTGSLAGYSFAMQSNKLISLAGLITGISATLSMATSEFLSARSDEEENPTKSATYTGIAYLLTVVLLIMPYLVLPDQWYGIALGIMLLLVILIIAVFNYYIAVAKDLSFKQRFKEMSIISLGVSALSFIIGLLVKRFLGIDL